jgi:hypothetical protein
MLFATALMLAAAAEPEAAAPRRDARPVLHYQRTNGDGSEPEDVVVFIRSPGDIAVMKAKSPCTNAAFVTARIDPASGQALALVGGRLQRDGSQGAFAWLSRDDASGLINARLGAPDAPPLLSAAVGPRWVLYDFDFADLIARPPKALREQANINFDLPLLLTGEGAPSLTNRGALALRYAGRDYVGRQAALRYRAAGPALGEASGTIWFDATSGRLLEARLPLANHAEYQDFRLRLVKSETGEAAWTARLAAHWQGCPAP